MGAAAAARGGPARELPFAPLMAASDGGLVRSLAHHLAGDGVQLPDEGALASFAGATAWLNSEPLDSGEPARQGRAGRLLDLHLRQLVAHAPVRARVGDQVSDSGAGGSRCPYARVPVRARPGQRARLADVVQGRLARRAGQRLRRVGRLQQPLLARDLPGRRSRARSASITLARASTPPRRWPSSAC